MFYIFCRWSIWNRYWVCRVCFFWIWIWLVVGRCCLECIVFFEFYFGLWWEGFLFLGFLMGVVLLNFFYGIEEWICYLLLGYRVLFFWFWDWFCGFFFWCYLCFMFYDVVLMIVIWWEINVYDFLMDWGKFWCFLMLMFVIGIWYVGVIFVVDFEYFFWCYWLVEF